MWKVSGIIGGAVALAPIKVAGREFNRRRSDRSKGGNGSSAVALIIDQAPDQRQAGAKDAGCQHVISTSTIVAESTRHGLVLPPWAGKLPLFAYCFDLHPKMHPNFILGRFWPIKINHQGRRKLLILLV